MKKTKFLLLAFILFSTVAINAQVGIGTNSPATSAQLDVFSTTKGFLPPRLTIAQRNAIVNPVEGLIIWCVECKRLQVYDGTTWQTIAWVVADLPGVTICTQTWSSKNLDVATYRDGTPIPKVTDPIEWQTLTTGAYCYYNNDSATYAATYGKLYNWYALNDPRGLAPSGWHIPTDEDWTTLSTCLGGDAVAGGAMKETGITHWASPNTGATNTSGFTAFPGGARDINGTFSGMGYSAYWWSSSEFITGYAWMRNLYFLYSSIIRSGYDKRNGYSVRCIKD